VQRLADDVDARLSAKYTWPGSFFRCTNWKARKRVWWKVLAIPIHATRKSTEVPSHLAVRFTNRKPRRRVSWDNSPSRSLCARRPPPAARPPAAATRPPAARPPARQPPARRPAQQQTTQISQRHFGESRTDKTLFWRQDGWTGTVAILAQGTNWADA
jgi:hypothetical protein